MLANSIIYFLLFSTTLYARERTIEVNGECQQEVTPDRASVTFTVETKEKELSKATEHLNEKSALLQKELKALKLKDAQFKTTHYQVNPEYNWANNKREFIGYSASLGLQVETSDIEHLPKSLEVASRLGVGNVGNLNTFLSTDLLKSEYQKCLTIALSNAKDKATELAHHYGAEVGPVLNILEGAKISPQGEPVVMRAMSLKSMEAGGAPDIMPGKEHFKATVQVIFELK